MSSLRSEPQKRPAKPSPKSPLRFFANHVHAAYTSLRRLARRPLSTSFTMMMIGLALCLPASLVLLLENISGITNELASSSQITLALFVNTQNDEISRLMNNLKEKHEIESIHYISAQQGLSDFKKSSGLGNVLNNLPTNPIPALIEVTPKESFRSPAAMKTLVAQLKDLPHVESAQLDMQWLERLNAIIDVAKQAAYGLMVILSIGVLLIIGSATRAAASSQRQEINLLKLLGSPASYIRRPFLYLGMFYGLGGGVLGLILIAALVYWLTPSVNQLMGLFQMPTHTFHLPTALAGLFLIVSMYLGLAAAFFTLD